MKYEVEYHIIHTVVVDAASKLEAAEAALRQAPEGAVVYKATPVFNQDVD